MYIVESNKHKAYKYLSELGQLIRMVLEHSRKPEISLKDEVKMLSLYCELEHARFIDKFNFSIVISPELDNEIKIPVMLIQPLVENAIIHGVLPNEKKGEIIVSFEPHKKGMLCLVSDNGIGRKASYTMKSNKSLHNSVGLNLLKERVRLLDKIKKKGHQIKVIDKLNKIGESEGTVVRLIIPF